MSIYSPFISDAKIEKAVMCITADPEFRSRFFRILEDNFVQTDSQFKNDDQRRRYSLSVVLDGLRMNSRLSPQQKQILRSVADSLGLGRVYEDIVVEHSGRSF